MRNAKKIGDAVHMVIVEVGKEKEIDPAFRRILHYPIDHQSASFVLSRATIVDIGEFAIRKYLDRALSLVNQGIFARCDQFS